MVIKIFHGSKHRDIAKLNFKYSRRNLDFGKGVYFTTNFKQAKERSCQHSNCGAVYESLIDLDKYKVLYLDKNSNDKIYIYYLCRLEMENIAVEAIKGFEDADIIIGDMLDGKIKNFKCLAEKFNEGDISISEFEKHIKEFSESYNQICIKTQQTLDDVNLNFKLVVKTVKQDGKIIEI